MRHSLWTYDGGKRMHQVGRVGGSRGTTRRIFIDRHVVKRVTRFGFV